MEQFHISELSEFTKLNAHTYLCRMAKRLRVDRGFKAKFEDFITEEAKLVMLSLNNAKLNCSKFIFELLAFEHLEF